MKPFVCFVVFYLISTNIFSQDTLKKDGFIYHQWPSWKMDGKRLTVKELKEEIYKVPEAIPYYEKSQTKKWIGYIGLILGVTFILISKNKDIYSVEYGNPKIGFLLAGIFFITASDYLILKSFSLLKKAINIHNKSNSIVY